MFAYWRPEFICCPWMWVDRAEEVEWKSVEVVVVELWVHISVMEFLEID